MGPSVKPFNSIIGLPWFTEGPNPCNSTDKKLSMCPPFKEKISGGRGLNYDSVWTDVGRKRCVQRRCEQSGGAVVSSKRGEPRGTQRARRKAISGCFGVSWSPLGSSVSPGLSDFYERLYSFLKFTNCFL
jgi:hypothetical protein